MRFNKFNTDDYQTNELKRMMKELVELNTRMVESKATPEVYKEDVKSFVKGWSSTINNMFTGPLSKYGIIRTIFGFLLIKYLNIFTLIQWVASMITTAGKAMKTVGDAAEWGYNATKTVGNYASKGYEVVKDSASSALNTIKDTATKVLDLLDDTNIKSVNEYNDYYAMRLNMTNNMINYLQTFRDKGLDYLGLIADNIDHFLFEKKPLELVQLCDKVSNLKDFNATKCADDVTNAYTLLHLQFPQFYNELMDPRTFNKMVSSVDFEDIYNDDVSPYLTLDNREFGTLPQSAYTLPQSAYTLPSTAYTLPQSASLPLAASNLINNATAAISQNATSNNLRALNATAPNNIFNWLISLFLPFIMMLFVMFKKPEIPIVNTYNSNENNTEEEIVYESEDEDNKDEVIVNVQ